MVCQRLKYPSNGFKLSKFLGKRLCIFYVYVQRFTAYLYDNIHSAFFLLNAYNMDVLPNKICGLKLQKHAMISMHGFENRLPPRKRRDKPCGSPDCMYDRDPASV